jgi:hypothetical protein
VIQALCGYGPAPINPMNPVNPMKWGGWLRGIFAFVGDLPMVGHDRCRTIPFVARHSRAHEGFRDSWLRFPRGTWYLLQAPLPEGQPHTFCADCLWLWAMFMSLGESLDYCEDVGRQKVYFCLVWTPYLNGVNGVHGVNGGVRVSSNGAASQEPSEAGDPCIQCGESFMLTVGGRRLCCRNRHRYTMSS